MFDKYCSDKNDAKLQEFFNLCSSLSATHIVKSDKHPENIFFLVKDSIIFAFENIQERYRFLDGIQYYVGKIPKANKTQM